MKLSHLFTLAALAIIVASCNTAKEIPYMIDADQLPQDVLNAAAKVNDPVLMPGDMLHIQVYGLNEETVKPFNKIDYIKTTNQMSNNNNSIYYYLIDNDGCIEFPMLGRLKISGMTKTATENYIASLIYPRYLTEKPGVEVRMQNFKVYILGEVKTPGEVQAPNGRMNILEAIAKAGDLTIQGKRDNVMLVRTATDGTRTVKRVNLNDKRLLVSPNFDLQQNDIIYVEPNASKARSSWQIPPALTLTVSSIGTLISIATFIVTLSK